MQDALDKELGSCADERFWTATIAVILQGAKYAKELSLCDIPLEPLKGFLITTLKDMRIHVGDNPTDMASIDSVSNVLAQYLNDMAGEHTLTTNIINSQLVRANHAVAGRPPTAAIKIATDTTKLGGIYVQVATDDKVIRLSTTHLERWLAQNRYPIKTFISSLKSDLGAVSCKARLGSGVTGRIIVQERVLDIDLTHSKAQGLIGT